jgi:hypothetical protein
MPSGEPVHPVRALGLLLVGVAATAALWVAAAPPPTVTVAPGAAGLP